MSFWDIVWFVVISFAFFAYLMGLVSIVSDLFQDRDVSGVAKAAWVVALIFMPFLSALIYLITRGRGMAERTGRSPALAQQQHDAHIREVARRTTAADQFAQARAMLDAGAISQFEYGALTTKALI
jgi:hypothetical protein